MRTISVHVFFQMSSPRWCCRRSKGIPSSLMLPEALDRWAALSAQGIVFEGMTKMVSKGVSRTLRRRTEIKAWKGRNGEW